MEHWARIGVSHRARRLRHGRRGLQSQVVGILPCHPPLHLQCCRQQLVVCELCAPGARLPQVSLVEYCLKFDIDGVISAGTTSSRPSVSFQMSTFSKYLLFTSSDCSDRWRSHPPRKHGSWCVSFFHSGTEAASHATDFSAGGLSVDEKKKNY